MGISSFVFSWLTNAKPFQSDLLDGLAETMRATRILKRGKLQRYYKVRLLEAGCLSYPDAVFFDAKYYDTLLPEELLAVAAHEFNHITNRHGEKRYVAVIAPALVISALVGALVFANYGLLSSSVFFRQSGRFLSSLFFAAFFFPLLLVASFYFNAKWFRMQEAQSDHSAVEFANGEALISALEKLRGLRPRKMKRLESRLLPKTYPTLEQRIVGIRVAMEKKRD